MKYFHNTIWRPQLSFLVAAVMVFLMLPCLPSCENNMVQPETNEEVSIFNQPEVLAKFEDDAEVIRKNIGGVHNGILERFYSKKSGKLGEKIPVEDFRNIFMASVNEEFQARGLQIRLNEVDVDLVIQNMTEFIKDTGIDLCNPRTINPSEALDKLVSKGYLTEEEARQCKHVNKCLEEGVSPYKADCGLLSATLPSENVKLYTEIGIASAAFWSTELHELYPELEWSWPDIDWDWEKIKEKVSLYVCDAIGAIGGGLIGLPSVIGALIGAAVGAAAASILFEVALIIF